VRLLVRSPPATAIYPLSLHDALPISGLGLAFATLRAAGAAADRGEALAQRNEHMRAVLGFLRARIASARPVAFDIDADSGLARRSEEHTSELQSRENLVCRLLLEKKK